MSRDYPAYPLPAVLAMVSRGDKVLLVRRDKEPAPGKWGFPGGLIETGESVTQAALRELAEETGIVAEAGPVAEVLELITPDGQGRTRFHFLLLAVPCRWLAGEPVAASDAAEAGWFSAEDIAALPCHPHLPRLALALFPGGAFNSALG